MILFLIYNKHFLLISKEIIYPDIYSLNFFEQCKKLDKKKKELESFYNLNNFFTEILKYGIL